MHAQEGTKGMNYTDDDKTKKSPAAMAGGNREKVDGRGLVIRIQGSVNSCHFETLALGDAHTRYCVCVQEELGKGMALEDFIRALEVLT